MLPWDRPQGMDELRHISPCFGNSYTCKGTQDVLSSVGVAIREMNEIQRSTLTLHFHLSMQAIVMDNITWPFSDVGTGADVRAEAQQVEGYVCRPDSRGGKDDNKGAYRPIVNINHDPRFIAIASTRGASVRDNVTAFLAMGTYVELELRVRGCVVIHGSSFWSTMACHLKPSVNYYQMLSWDASGNGYERQMVYRGWAIYEKQLFTEKIVSVCFMDPSKVSQWDDNIKASMLNQQEFTEIWEDRGRIDVSMGVSASTWFDAERRQSIESGAQGDSIAEHASAIWQDFDSALIMPEPYYDQRQYWFKIETYATTEYRYALGKTFFCPACRDTQEPETYQRARFLVGGNGYANACIGCAHFNALKVQSHIGDVKELADWQRYGLASAMYVYDKYLQFKNPCEDMAAFLKACAPIAYTDYGKAISHYGGLRIAPWQAIEYAGCGKAKQLAWDRAYDASNNLCYICYYDAGNSVYAGFMKSILKPEDRRELYFGVTDPREELLGDTLELALGILTMAIRYPKHFINWGGSDGANACVRGIERSIWRYAAAEAIELLTADQPRRRSPPRRDEDVENYLRSMTQGLTVVLEAVVDGDREFPQQPTGEVSTAPPMPEESAGSENVQPEEENEAADLSHGLRQAGIRHDRPARNWQNHDWYSRVYVLRSLRKLKAYRLARLSH